MSGAHGRQELLCNSWVGKFLRNSGQCLNIKRQVGVLLWEHRGWILRMAFSYKAKAFRTTAFFPLFQHTAFYFPPTYVGPPLSPERETFCMLSICRAFAYLLFLKENIPLHSCNLQRLHRPENPSGFLPTYEPLLIPTCESKKDSHRQQT